MKFAQGLRTFYRQWFGSRKRQPLRTRCQLSVEALENRLVPATISTDLEDYSFGSTVNISGAGFQAGETVNLQVVHALGTPGSNDDPQNAVFQTVADADGNLIATWSVTDPDAVGATYVLIATGVISGEQATTQFTDDGTPGVPINLDATVISATQINLSWDRDGANTAEEYHLERSTSATFASGTITEFTIADTGTTTYFHNDTGLTPGTTYYYRVRAHTHNATGGNAEFSAYSTSTSETTASLNQDPVVTGPVSFTTDEDAAADSVDLLEGASDPDGDTLSITDLTKTNAGDDSGITRNGASLDIDPSAYNYLSLGESAIITYSYTIEDGNGGSVPQTATITIEGRNDDPELAALTTPLTTCANEQVSFTATATDVDLNDTHTYSLVGAPDGASIDETTGAFTWTPTLAQAGGIAGTDYTFTVRVDDNHGGFDEQSVTIHVDPYRLGAGGGLGIGYWMNKNGKDAVSGSDLTALTALNLKDNKGNDFTPTNYGDLKKWLQNAKASPGDVNGMKYMLSAQLAAAKLTALHDSSIGSKLLYTDLAGIPGGSETMSYDQLMALANTALAAGSGYTRAQLELIKNALEAANSNQNFILNC